MGTNGDQKKTMGLTDDEAWVSRLLQKVLGGDDEKLEEFLGERLGFDFKKWFSAATQGMRAEDKSLLLAYYKDGLSTRQLAAKLSKSVGATADRLNKAVSYIARNNREVYDFLAKENNEFPVPDAIKNIPIQNLALSNRSRAALMRNRFRTLEDLLHYCGCNRAMIAGKLQILPGLGEKSVLEVEEALLQALAAQEADTDAVVKDLCIGELEASRLSLRALRCLKQADFKTLAEVKEAYAKNTIELMAIPGMTLRAATEVARLITAK